MLVLSRYRDESIYIGDDVVITVVDIRGDRVRIGVQAPPHVTVHRQEVYDAIKNEKLGSGTRKENGRTPAVPLVARSSSMPLSPELNKRKEKITAEAKALPINIEPPAGFDSMSDMVPQ